MDVREEFENLIRDTFEEIGGDLSSSKEELSAYMAERANHLATITHEPGFDRAVILERNSVAMKAGLQVAAASEAARMQWLGVIGGALRIAALALV